MLKPNFEKADGLDISHIHVIFNKPALLTPQGLNLESTTYLSTFLLYIIVILTYLSFEIYDWLNLYQERCYLISHNIIGITQSSVIKWVSL